ncbi:DUF3089 domain-containing protein [soil metagenome]
MGTRGTAQRWGIAFGVTVAIVAALASCSGSETGGAGPNDTDQAGSSTTVDSAPTTEPPATDAPLERYAGYSSAVYSDPASWLCRPDTEDVCDGDLDATVVQSDGTLTEQPWSADPDAPIDCFYVYPTISRDTTTNSDMVASDDEEGFAAVNQVARLGQECRVFAPIYRQRTLAGLSAALAGGTGGGGEDPAFADVLAAWKQYLANDNDGRGVVLIGHSQGSGMLAQLLTSEFDPNPDVRERLVAAYLAGASIQVPEGADVGGDVAEVPLCRADDQTGCLVTWSSFRSTAPPTQGAYFGRPGGDGMVAACTSPAALAGGPSEATSYFPSAPGASILAGLGTGTGGGTTWVDPSVGEVRTPFVSTPGLVSVECANHDGYNFLQVTVNGDPSDPRVDDIGGDLTPEWGLHLQDLNLVMGDVVNLVRRQRDAYLADHR